MAIALHAPGGAEHPETESELSETCSASVSIKTYNNKA